MVYRRGAKSTPMVMNHVLEFCWIIMAQRQHSATSITRGIVQVAGQRLRPRKVLLIRADVHPEL